jgi:uncharacterized protein (TIGR02246 family)
MLLRPRRRPGIRACTIGCGAIAAAQEETVEPEDIHPMFAEAFNAGDVERLLALYEPEARLLPGQGPVRSGSLEIRETLERFLAGKGRMTIETAYSIRMGEIALLQAKWRLTTKQAGGEDRVVESRSAEVVRRQPDGRWLYIIDYPFGGDIPS